MQHQLWRNSLGIATHCPNVIPGEVYDFRECPPGQRGLCCCSKSPSWLPWPCHLFPLQWRWLQPTAALPRLLMSQVRLQCRWHLSLGAPEPPHTHILNPPHCPDLPAKDCHAMNVSPAPSYNIWWFLVINNLPQNQKVPAVLRTFLFFLPANSCFLNLPSCFFFLNQFVSSSV